MSSFETKSMDQFWVRSK